MKSPAVHIPTLHIYIILSGLTRYVWTDVYRLLIETKQIRMIQTVFNLRWVYNG